MVLQTPTRQTTLDTPNPRMAMIAPSFPTLYQNLSNYLHEVKIEIEDSIGVVRGEKTLTPI